MTDRYMRRRVASPSMPVAGLRRDGALVAVLALWLLWLPTAAAAGPRPVAAACTGTESLTGLDAQVGGATVAIRKRVVSGVVQGATVTMGFTVRERCAPVTVSLVAYRAPGPTFVRADAAKQKVFGSATDVFGAGPGSLSVVLPTCYFQVDLVIGAVRSTFGGPHSDGFYAREHRLVAHATGGTTACVQVLGRKTVRLPRTGAPIADLVLLGWLGVVAGGLLCLGGRRSWYERYGETF